MDRYQGPRVDTTVDVVVHCTDTDRILLGLKREIDRAVGCWHIPGGFLDPLKDYCPLDAAVRELREETGLQIRHTAFEYLGCFNVPDPRYDDIPDKVFTHLYVVHVRWGDGNAPLMAAQDDLVDLQWFSVGEGRVALPDHHQELGEVLNEHLKYRYPAIHRVHGLAQFSQ